MRGKRKTFGSKLKIWMAALVLLVGMLFYPFTVKAENIISFGFVSLYRGEESVGTSPAFVLNVGKGWVVTSLMDTSNYDTAEYRGTHNGNTVALSITNYQPSSELKTAMWDVAEEDSASVAGASLEADIPVQGDNLTITYVYRNDAGELKLGQQKATAQDLNEMQLILSDYPGGKIYYPSAIQNERGDCVGYMIDDEEAICVWADKDAFYGNSGESNKPADEPDDEPQDVPDDEPEQTPESNKPMDVPADNKKEGGFMSDILSGAMIGAVVGGIIAIVRMIKKKGKKDSVKAVNNNEIPNKKAEPLVEEIGETIGVDEIGATAPIEEDVHNVHQEPKPAWLVARGGYMDGRVYPINENGITIGRDVSNVVRYPVETPGVSRNHVKIYWDGSRLMLIDCGSSSGTFVQSIGKIQPMNPIEIKIGETIYIGEKKNAFEIK